MTPMTTALLRTTPTPSCRLPFPRSSACASSASPDCGRQRPAEDCPKPTHSDPPYRSTCHHHQNHHRRRPSTVPTQRHKCGPPPRPHAPTFDPSTCRFTLFRSAIDLPRPDPAPAIASGRTDAATELLRWRWIRRSWRLPLLITNDNLRRADSLTPRCSCHQSSRTGCSSRGLAVAALGIWTDGVGFPCRG